MSRNAIEVHNLTKRFGEFTAVDNLSFAVKEGEIFGFLGANGAGKSTTIRMLIGLLQPTSGTARVGGYDIIQQTEQLKRSIGYMSQRFSLYDDLTVEQNIRFYGGVYGLKEFPLERADGMGAHDGGLKGPRKELDEDTLGRLEATPRAWLCHFARSPHRVS